MSLKAGSASSSFGFWGGSTCREVKQIEHYVSSKFCSIFNSSSSL
jgi:hypothetical protein